MGSLLTLNGKETIVVFFPFPPLLPIWFAIKIIRAPRYSRVKISVFVFSTDKKRIPKALPAFLRLNVDKKPPPPQEETLSIKKDCILILKSIAPFGF